MVIFGSNQNATAPKNSGQKLEWRRSICVDMVCKTNHEAGMVYWYDTGL